MRTGEFKQAGTPNPKQKEKIAIQGIGKTSWASSCKTKKKKTSKRPVKNKPRKENKTRDGYCRPKERTKKQQKRECLADKRKSVTQWHGTEV